MIRAKQGRETAPTGASDELAAGQEATSVLYLIDQLSGVGGAESALIKILTHLPRDRFRPHVATFDYNPDFPARGALTAPLHVFPLRRTYDLNALKMAHRLRRLIRDENIRIVHTFFETSDLWGGLVAKWSGCPVLISSRRDMGFQRSRKHQLAYRLLGRMFDQVQAVSEKVREFTVQQDLLPPERVVTVYNGVDLSLDSLSISRADFCRKIDVAPPGRIVITVANIRPVKGIDVFVRTAARVCSDCPDAVFVLVGDTPDPEYFRQIRELAATLGVSDRLRYWGPDRDVGRLLVAADVFALLSHSEGFSNALIEAMACGLPCVVSDVGGNSEAVRSGQNGYVVAPGDDRAAAAHIADLLGNPDERRRMGEESRLLARRHFTMAAVMQRLTSCYEGLLSRSVATHG